MKSRKNSHNNNRRNGLDLAFNLRRGGDRIEDPRYVRITLTEVTTEWLVDEDGEPCKSPSSSPSEKKDKDPYIVWRVWNGLFRQD
jgi:hypothetical protein